MEQNIVPVIVGETIAGEAAATRKELEALIVSVNSSSFDIGNLLHKIKKNGFYSGFTTFAEYEKTLKDLGIKLRTAQYLRKISEVMEAVEISRDVYEPLGKSKLRAITSLDPAGIWTNPETSVKMPLSDFIVGFVQRGMEMSLADIQQHVRTLKGFVGENDLEYLRFVVLRSVAENVIRPAIELAKNALGSSFKDDEGISHDASDGRALEVICIEFINDPANNYMGGAE